MLFYIKSSLLAVSGLHDVYFNEAQQESLKLYIWGTKWEIPPKNGKANSSLLPQGFTCYTIPFSIQCWYFLLSPAGTALWGTTYGRARPSKYALVWQSHHPKWEAGLCSGFNASSRWGNHIFQAITDLVKWSSHQQGACGALPYLTCFMLFEGNS